jgi:hypothetical protein
MLFYEYNFFGTAAKRFETQRARSGVEIKDDETGPCQSGVQTREESFTHAVGRGPGSLGGHYQPTTTR